jgi:pectate lyase
MRLVPALVLLTTSLASSAELPAFPGAEGFGWRTPGGRGGKVLFVHNLNDSGPGSLRAACEAEGPRIVLFRVAGIIELRTPITITQPFLTIARQTAPGDGVCLRGRGLDVDTHDVVIRHLRVRPGDISGTETDAIAIGGSSYNVIVDHCSASWGVDENLSPSGGIRDVTVSWCIISEGLNRSVHHKGNHGYGSLVRAIGGVSLHHNLWAHNNGRNPRMGDNYGRSPSPLLDIRNNVIYNYRGLSMVGERLNVNYIGNYLRPGPNSITATQFSPTKTATANFYLDDNVVEGQPNRPLDAWLPKAHQEGYGGITVVKAAFDAVVVKTVSAVRALEDVLAGAGATLPIRDAVDARIVSECRERTGAIIDSQWEVGGWPDYRRARPPVDLDRDGMPDEWEIAHKLNPRDPADATRGGGTGGYTNIELYINSLTARESSHGSPGQSGVADRF